MQKIYTTDFKTSQKNDLENTIGPRAEVLQNILNFSKSLEVLKKKSSGIPDHRNVEIVLN